MSKPKLKVGDVLYFVPDERRGHPRDVTVEAVGRKWVTIKGFYSREMRINIETWYADGGGYSSPGRCYVDLAEYQAEVRRNEVWFEFRQAVERKYGSPPETDKVIEAARLIGVELPSVRSSP